jgi:tripartite-type tricarboxylate transporter receptor subunit TctC
MVQFFKSKKGLLGILLMALLSSVHAFPNKPIKLVVPYPAGGAADVMARGLALKMSTELGQPIVIDNRGGASGTTASELVAKSSPDGYTLLFGAMQTHAINPALYDKLRYDPIKDFSPISLTHINPRVLVVSSALQINSVAELIALAKKKPDSISFGSAGNGSSSHLAGVLFANLTDTDLMHVPYKGSAPLVTDLLSGRVNISFDSYTVYAGHIKSGKVKALAVTSKDRMQVLPDVPTLNESGLKGYEILNWLGLLAPAGTPDAVIKSLNRVAVQSMKSADLRQQLLEVGVEPAFSTPAQFSDLIKADGVKWAEIVKKSGATID